LTGLKKNLDLSADDKRKSIEPNNNRISVRCQCRLLGLSRATYYSCMPAIGKESDANLEIMKKIDMLYLERPFLGSRQMVLALRDLDCHVNRKRVQRLMRLMGIESTLPKPGTSKPQPGHKIYPYLLKGHEITRPNQVWSTDITYIPLRRGYMYLVAIIDWNSRKILSWRLSNTLDTLFCIDALKEALNKYGAPEIFNSDQGCQFTSTAFTSVLINSGIHISMDSKGRALDNIMIERFWRTIKYECIYIKEHNTVKELTDSIERYIYYYNAIRRHSSIGNETPDKVYKQNTGVKAA